MEYTLRPGQEHPPRPKNWLPESILVTIFCCLPFGIVGIVFASHLNAKYDAGDYAGAMIASPGGQMGKNRLFRGYCCGPSM
jgi:hypothetical protein